MATAKEELRRALRGVRDSIAPEAARASAAAAAAHLLRLAPVGAARSVALYAAMRGELDPTPIAEALASRGVVLAYPRVLPGQRRLGFFRAHAAQLVPGTWGILEPPAAAPAVAVDEIDVFVVPGLAFDATGTRLGWGRGYYDHTLPRDTGVRIGYCFACQLVDHVPRAADDLPMHYLVTEDGALAVGGPLGRGD